MPYSGVYCFSEPQTENQRKQKERQVLRPCQRTKKAVEDEVTVIPVVIGMLQIVLKDLEKRLEKLEIREWIKTIQTTALLRLDRIRRRVLETWGHFAVTQIPVKIYQLMLVQKTCKVYNYKRTCHLEYFAIPAEHRVKIKETKIMDKYLDVAKELKKNCETWRWRWYQL